MKGKQTSTILHVSLEYLTTLALITECQVFFSYPYFLRPHVGTERQAASGHSDACLCD